MNDSRDKLGKTGEKVRFGLFAKIFLSFSLLFLLLMVTVIIVTSTLSGQILLENAYTNISGYVEQINRDITSVKELMQTVSIRFTDKHHMIYYFRERDYTLKGVRLQNDILNELSTTGRLSIYMDIDLYHLRTGHITSTAHRHNRLDFRNCGKSLNWVNRILEYDLEMIFLTDYPVPTSRLEPGRLGIVRKYHDFNRSVIGLSVISLAPSYFESAIFTDKLFEHLIISDQNFGIIYSTTPNLIASNELEYWLSEQDNSNDRPILALENQYIVSATFSEYTGIWVIALTSYENIRASINIVSRALIVTAVAFAFAMLFVSWFLSYKVTNRIKRLSTVMSHAVSAERHSPIISSGNDEVTQLYMNFNLMMDRLYEMRKLRNEAEINALLQQINPHMLYNTLGMIGSMAEQRGALEVAEITERLSDMFRYSVRVDMPEFVALKEELKHVENFMFIQQIRFIGKYSIEYQFDEKMLDCKIMKLVLQPIVENAVYHGLEKKIGQGVILLRGYQEGEDLFIEICDNGVGIAKTKLDRLRKQLAQNNISNEDNTRSSGGIALRNVNARIHLIYGEGYGLAIDSELGEGTQVTIKIKAVPTLNNDDTH